MCISELFAYFNAGSVIAIILGIVIGYVILSAFERIFGLLWGNILYPLIWLGFAIYFIITIPIVWC